VVTNGIIVANRTYGQPALVASTNATSKRRRRKMRIEMLDSDSGYLFQIEYGLSEIAIHKGPYVLCVAKNDLGLEEAIRTLISVTSAFKEKLSKGARFPSCEVEVTIRKDGEPERKLIRVTYGKPESGYFTSYVGDKRVFFTSLPERTVSYLDKYFDNLLKEILLVVGEPKK
jgi:hypothetical protein